MNTGSDGGGGNSKDINDEEIKILIINYGAGNLRSVANAFRLLSVKTEIVNIGDLNENIIGKFDAIVLPGVGNFEILAEAIKGKEEIFRNLKKPFLGICLGLQILLDGSKEAEDAEGLGIVAGGNIKFRNLKIPHIGWNEINVLKMHPVLSGLDNGFFYFVHSYYASPKSNDYVSASCNYGVDFPAVIVKENFIATQFHPEKSGEAGIKLLKNFINWVKFS
ncbi:MAG: imidazole glycerol phosphate synthase subunit HisH [Candidatus Altiarchaeales archaeon HGW-Altiarchaeales-1]|nr:MAG: imidazole glycerol phosphate synthase subunit HisH [Candidatus Altiarchaeales archaeon HGW-Altiarchaeales-1]